MKMAKLDHWVREKEGLAVLDREAIEALQLRKLNLLLARERKRGGYYRNLPARVEHLSEWEKLPFTTEEDLRKNGHRMLLLSQSLVERVRTEKTSGTGGAGKRVYYSAADQERTVSFFAAGLSELVNAGEKTLIAMPFSGENGLGELIADAIRLLGACPVAAGVGKSYRELSGLMEREKPETFVGMPVPLLSLLRLGSGKSLQRALISADACPDGVLEEIGKYLAGPSPAVRLSAAGRIYPHYGSREMGLGGAVTCPAFEGMHLRENDVYPEIIGEDGRTLPRGEWGELVITTMQADAMPLVRYRTGDRTRILREDCPCGSRLCRIDRVTRLGESGDMAVLDDIFFRRPEVIDYRAGLREGVLWISGYRTASGGGLPDEWKGHPIRYRWQPASKDQAPCYPAKRRILTENDTGAAR